ncbi:tellurite resistance protein [Aurantimicrobium minutum]|uniref:SLAC1 anion channel family protein n=1 Tax=Aurantimicrobium minutum TaxID=708131 RepID=UPI002475CAFA|nr:SLAC1 anion channel family protein [Aurantimicrobium minutum]MDH6532736.1 tellurite resistance protein [Aurantimicrobium minutum]
MRETSAEAASIRHLPIALFTTVMGLGGLTIATEKLEFLLDWHAGLSMMLLFITAAVWLTVFAAYVTKIIRFPGSVTDELNHPVRLSFFPTTSIGLILIATASYVYFPAFAQGLWWVAVAVQLCFALFILDRWIHREHFSTEHNSPAWFIPIIANLLVPILGGELGYLEVSYFFFAIGIVFWLPLMAISLNRSFFHAPMPQRLLPTLFIFIVPPSIGFTAWTSMHGGQVDDFGRVMYFFGLFMTMMVITQFRRFIGLPFTITMWAFSFPLAAITIASFIYYGQVQEVFFLVVAVSLYVVLAVLVIVLVIKTAVAVARKKVLLPES